jgi:hypothetical protein
MKKERTKVDPSKFHFLYMHLGPEKGIPLRQNKKKK